MEGERNIQDSGNSSDALSERRLGHVPINAAIQTGESGERDGFPNHGYEVDGSNIFSPPPYKDSVGNSQPQDADLNSDEMLSGQEDKIPQKKRIKRLAIASLMTTFLLTGYTIFNDAYSQWRYVRFKQDVLGSNYSLLNISDVGNPCLNSNNTGQFKAQLDEAQKRTSTFVSWTYVCGLLPSVFFNILVGPYIDKIGRKPFFVIPAFGFAIHMIVSWAVCYWHLNMYLLLAGYSIEGITGSLGAVSMALYVYTADHTKGNQSRSYAMVVVQTVTNIALPLTHVTVGYFIKYEGYAWPMATGCILAVLGAMGFMIFLEESLKKSKRLDCFSPLEGAKRTFHFYVIKTEDPKHKRKDYIFLAFIFFLFGTGIAVSIQTLYVQNEPFCWNSTKIGYVTTIQGLLQAIGPLILVHILQRYIGDDFICAIALITSAAGKGTLAFANYEWMLYIGLSFSLLEGTPLTLIRAILSRMVPFKYRGSLFASLAAIEVGTYAAAGAGLSSVYSETVSWWKGFTYCVVAVCLILACILMIVFAAAIRRRISRLTDVQGYESLSGEDHSNKDDRTVLVL